MKRMGKFFVLMILFGSVNISYAASSKIGIIVFDGFLTSDVTAPVEVFGAASKKSEFSSYEVVLISATRDLKVRSEEGLTILADQTIYDDVVLDVLIAPSAYSMDGLIGNSDLIGFIRKQGVKASWLASNCSGSSLLGEAGMLDGKKATTWPGGEKGLKDSYPAIDVQYDTNVVVDGRIVTSNGGPVSYQAALELLSEMTSQKFSDEVSGSIQFDRLSRTFK